MVIDVGKTMPPPRNMTGGMVTKEAINSDWGDGKHGIVLPTLLWSHMLI